MGKRSIPAKSTVYPRFQMVSLEEIKRVHPAVSKKLQERSAEPFVGLGAVSDELINDVFAFPRMAVVPIPGELGYWCWIGARVFQRLVDCNWCGNVAVLNYGPRMPEESIVDQALKDWDFSPAVLGQSAKSDRATAGNWEAKSEYICRPAKSGSRLRPSGRKVYARLRGLDSRPLRADEVSRAPELSSTTGPAELGNDEKGTEK